MFASSVYLGMPAFGRVSKILLAIIRIVEIIWQQPESRSGFAHSFA